MTRAITRLSVHVEARLSVHVEDKTAITRLSVHVEEKTSLSIYHKGSYKIRWSVLVEGKNNIISPR